MSGNATGRVIAGPSRSPRMAPTTRTPRPVRRPAPACALPTSHFTLHTSAFGAPAPPPPLTRHTVEFPCVRTHPRANPPAPSVNSPDSPERPIPQVARLTSRTLAVEGNATFRQPTEADPPPGHLPPPLPHPQNSEQLTNAVPIFNLPFRYLAGAPHPPAARFTDAAGTPIPLNPLSVESQNAHVLSTCSP